MGYSSHFIYGVNWFTFCIDTFKNLRCESDILQYSSNLVFSAFVCLALSVRRCFASLSPKSRLVKMEVIVA